MNLFSLTITEVPLGLCVGGGALRGDWTSLWMRMTGRWKQAEVLVNTGTATNRCSGQPSSTGLDWPCLLLYFISLFFLLSYQSVSSFLFILVSKTECVLHSIYSSLLHYNSLCVCVCRPVFNCFHACFPNNKVYWTHLSIINMASHLTGHYCQWNTVTNGVCVCVTALWVRWVVTWMNEQ